MERKELVLYSISLMKDTETSRKDYFKQNIASALDISDSTLDHYIGLLHRDGMIEKKRSKIIRPISDTITITTLGINELKMVEDVVSRFLLTPERHNVPSCVQVGSILKRIRDPMEKIFFLSVFTRLKRFNLMVFLEALRYSRSDSNLLNVLSDMDSNGKDGEDGTLVNSLFRTYMFAEFDEESFMRSADLSRDLDSIILLANAYHRQGRNHDAKDLFNIVLSERSRPTQNQWFLANYGLARVIRSDGDPEGSIRLLDRTMEMTDNKVYHAMLKERKAITLSDLGRMEEAEANFNSANHSFISFGIPVLSSFLHNDRGIHYLRQDRIDEAANEWRKGLKMAKEARSEYIEASLLTNISDIEMREGKLVRAEKSLSKAREKFALRNDLEGIAAVEFNQALLMLYKKDAKKANEIFRRSEETAYPAPSAIERKERRMVFLATAKELGVEGAEVPERPVDA